MKAELLLICLVHIFTTFGEEVFVKTQTAGNIKGKVEKVDGKSYNVFLGIPYAKPPLEDLRFKEPEPLDNKDSATVVDASHDFSKTCIQAIKLTSQEQSEDCLYLNVMSPKDAGSKKYPVMVWIHGGGFTMGSASDYGVEGTLENMVSRGVIFVSINYRVSTFGFMTTKSCAAGGNYGLFDQVEALRWVQKNIQFFGGDPTKVTIFGESAGGSSVSFLTISPLAEGLYQQAILMSGSSFAPWALNYDADPNDASATLLETLGCRQYRTKKAAASCPYKNIVSDEVEPDVMKENEKEMDCLRSKSVEEIAAQTFAAMSMKPRIDGKFLPESPELLMKKRKPLNLMMGVTREENGFMRNTHSTYPTHDVFLSSLVKIDTHSKIMRIVTEFMNIHGISSGVCQTESQYNSSNARIDCNLFKFPKMVDFTVRVHYAHLSSPEKSGLDEKHFWFQQTVKRDSAHLFVMPVYRDAVEAVNTKSTVYLYSYDWQNAVDYYDSKTDFYWKGAAHASDLLSLFHTDTLITIFNRNAAHTKRDKSHDSRTDEVFGKLWTNFAKTGNPTPDNSIDGVIWKPFSVKDGNYLSIDMPKIEMADKFFEDDVAFWTRFLPALEESVDCG